MARSLTLSSDLSSAGPYTSVRETPHWHHTRADLLPFHRHLCEYALRVCVRVCVCVRACVCVLKCVFASLMFFFSRLGLLGRSPFAFLRNDLTLQLCSKTEKID